MATALQSELQDTSGGDGSVAMAPPEELQDTCSGDNNVAAALVAEQQDTAEGEFQSLLRNMEQQGRLQEEKPFLSMSEAAKRRCSPRGSEDWVRV